MCAGAHLQRQVESRVLSNGAPLYAPYAAWSSAITYTATTSFLLKKVVLGEVKDLPASLGAICNDYITRIAQVKSCIASLAACSNPVDHSSYESLRAEANVCAIRSADLLAIACRGGALIQGGLAEQRTLESRFFLTWAMSPGCQQKTLGQL